MISFTLTQILVDFLQVLSPVDKSGALWIPLKQNMLHCCIFSNQSKVSKGTWSEDHFLSSYLRKSTLFLIYFDFFVLESPGSLSGKRRKFGQFSGFTNSLTISASCSFFNDSGLLRAFYPNILHNFTVHPQNHRKQPKFMPFLILWKKPPLKRGSRKACQRGTFTVFSGMGGKSMQNGRWEGWNRITTTRWSDFRVLPASINFTIEWHRFCCF